MSDLIWEFYQHGKIIRASADASQALSNSNEFSADVRSLERKIDRLALLSQAIWSLIREKTSLTDAELMDEIKRIDMLDGCLDGKVSETKKCIKCGTVLTSSADNCYSCGAKNSITSAFHSI